MLRTKDLALATTLRLYGHEPVEMSINGSNEGVWVFNNDAKPVAGRYRDGEALVEPREYNRILRRTREDLFKFLGERGLGPHRAKVAR
jgi:hypothetical protein